MSVDIKHRVNNNDLFSQLMGPATGKPVKQKPLKSSTEKDGRIKELSDTIKKVNALNIFIASQLKKEKQKTARLESENQLLKEQMEHIVDDNLSIEDVIDADEEL